jgi:hypothetical protein
LPLPRSKGEGERCAGAPAGDVVAPGRPTPGLPCPRSKGAGETPAGAPPGGVAFAPGGTRPGLPFGPGETGGAPPAAGAGGLAPTADGGVPPPRAAAPVGGGTFLGFSFLIFCFSCASLATPAQPRLIFGCATLVFTAGGLAPGDALVSLFGAATTSLFPCTFVSAPDLAAAEKLVADCRSMLSR